MTELPIANHQHKTGTVPYVAFIIDNVLQYSKVKDAIIQDGDTTR